jgi:medium-chain acyl-[acyl-carrier-protein] hydrolase
MENFLARNFKISSFDLDPMGRARLTSLAGFFQEMAYLHANTLGFGFHDLEENGSFWVLSRMRIAVDRYPVWDEEISVETWHNGVDRLFGLREFRVVNRFEEPIARATSAWLILDAHSRRPVRPDEGLLDAGTGRGFLFRERLGKIDIPDSRVSLGTRRVVYSDLDIMGHVNNVKYMEWCVDLCMDHRKTLTAAGDEKAGQPGGEGIRELEINYTGEARLGETIEILGSETNRPVDQVPPREMLFLARDAVAGKEVFRARVLVGE